VFNGLVLQRLYTPCPFNTCARWTPSRSLPGGICVPLVRHTSIKPLPCCRAAAIKQMLTPRLRHLGSPLRVLPPPPPSPPSSRRTRITFCNGAYSTSSYRPILTPTIPEAERPARSLDMQPRTTRVSLNVTISAIPRDYVWPSSFGTPFSTLSVVHVATFFHFSFSPPSLMLIRLLTMFLVLSRVRRI